MDTGINKLIALLTFSIFCLLKVAAQEKEIIVGQGQYAYWVYEETGSYYIGKTEYVCSTVTIIPPPDGRDIFIMLSPVFNYYDGYANKHMVWGYSEWFTSCWSYDYQPSISLMVWKFIPKGEKFTVNIAHPREVTKETILGALRPSFGRPDMLTEPGLRETAYRGSAINIVI